MQKERVYLSKEREFKLKDFASPDVTYAPMYVWIWNAPISREETRKQLEEMQRLGIRAMYILPEPKSFRPSTMPTLLEPDYLTAPYFEEFQYATKEAEKMGITMWLYDEGGWPSGGACGKVLLKYPEYAKQGLASRIKEVNAGTVYEMPADTAAAFLESGEPIESGYIFTSEEKVTEYYSKVSLFENPSFPDFPDLTRKESTEAFVEIGLESYKPYIGDSFGQSVTMVFTDEPSMTRPVPFHAELLEEFERRNGYSVKPYLPELLGNKPVTSNEAAMARIRWYDLCSDWFCQNFLMTEKEWANRNNMSFTGHFGGEDRIIYNVRGGYGHIMRGLRCFDVPGVDAIWRQIFPMEEPGEWNPVTGISGENRFFPRYASSAAVQTGSQRVMTESCGVYGAGLTFAEMRFIFNFQAVRGVNVYNLFSVPYAREGFLMTGELPFMTEKHACYGDLPVFNQYLERLSYVTSLGQSANKVALYMPVWDIWAGENSEWYEEAFERIGKELEDDHISFDIFDDDVLQYADAKAIMHGDIRMGDASYTTLVIPPSKYMPELTVKKLEQFAAGGGKVYMIYDKEMPKICGAFTLDSMKGLLDSPVKITGDDRLLRTAERVLDNGRIYYIFNERVTDAEFGVCLPGEQGGTDSSNVTNIYLLDLNSGKVSLPHYENGEIKLHLASGDMAVILCTEESLDAEKVPVLINGEALEVPFTFRRTNRFIIGEKTYISEDISEEEQAIQLGDWSEVVGKDFSGSGVYKTVFALPLAVDAVKDCVVDLDKKVCNEKGIDTKDIVCLDLGEVHYTCEAFLNGQSLGVRVMAPYRYEIPVRMLQEENVLEIRVSNTPANEYNYTKSFDKWQEWQLSPYWPREKVYHEDSLSGGLYGPVKLLLEKN